MCELLRYLKKTCIFQYNLSTKTPDNLTIMTLHALELACLKKCFFLLPRAHKKVHLYHDILESLNSGKVQCFLYLYKEIPTSL
jgi:hypothetical protein